MTKQINFVSNDRILILAPHPDDEVLGCGGIIQEANSNNLPIQICFLTYGDANEMSFINYCKRLVIRSKTIKHLGLIRHKEAIKADKLLGINAKDIIFLGYPDLGNLEIWQFHWGFNKPYISLLTRVNKVPYDNAYRSQALYKGEEILKDLENVIKKFKPTKIFLSHPADQHPDHRALYLFTQVVLWNLEKDINPEVYSYLIHHTVNKWPLPQGYYPNKKITPPILLGKIINWQEYCLDFKKVQKKLKALKNHQTQYEFDYNYLESYIRSNEIFGDFSINKLIYNKPHPIIPDEAGDLVKIVPELLAYFKKAIYGGFEIWSVRREDRYLNFTIKFTRPFSRQVDFLFFVYGYRNNLDFSAMPKLKIKTFYNKYNVYDQKEKIIDRNKNIIRDHKKIEIKIPMKILNEPQKILFAAISYRKDVLFDWISWRKIII